MTFIIFSACLLLVVLAMAIRLDAQERGAPSIKLSTLKSAIAQVEGWSGKDGAAGEKGRYQITKSLWYQYTIEDFTDENVERLEDEIVDLHLDWIKLHLNKGRYQVTPYSVALVYCAGWTAYNTRTYSIRKGDYAERVDAIYWRSK